MPEPKPRCQALNSDGLRCRHRGADWYGYHGDDEIYDEGNRPGWVLAWLCRYHKTGLPFEPPSTSSTTDVSDG